ncbi:MAG: glycine--tRNA ligase subunit beta, partial [Thermoanaerobaculia bacterium]|nr:glycine--tRNA ligase subunit beta [Thermoanaerobaculia bacterium]
MTRGEFLLEVRAEEIPARMLPPATQELGSRIFEELMARRMPPASVLSTFTPRRLVLVLEGLPGREPDRDEEVLGPPVSAGFRPDGTPTPAAEGFARRCGVEVGALARRRSEKGEYLAAVRHLPGRGTVEVLAELLPRLLAGLQWAKTMRWGTGTGPWVRPVHGIVALYDGEVVPVSFFDVTAGELTAGHTTQSPELQFNVHVATTGTYHVWVRGWATGGGDDSVHVGLNGAAVSSADRIQFNTKGAWVWTKTTLDGPVATLSIRSAGTHTINVWMREDGLRIDQLLLTTDASFVPGKTATATSTPTPTPTSTPTPTPTTAAETMAVTQLMLVNADTDRDLWPLVNGATLDFATLPTRNLSVRAEVAGSVGSVVFSLDGKRIQTESIVPYTIAGDTNGDYNPWTPPVGSRTLIVTPYSAAGASGSSGTALTVSFTVTDTLTQATPTPTPSPTPTAPSDGGSYVESGVACGATGVLRTVNVSTATQLS